MPGSFYKYSDLLKKLPFLGAAFLSTLGLPGCASTHPDQAQGSYDEPHNISQKAQADWESHPYTASADYHFALAQAYSTEGKVDRAIEEFKAALAYDPNSSVLHAKLAAEYLKKGVTSFSIDECKKAIELDPHYLDVRLMLGGIYSINNEIEAAMAQYDAVLKMDPKNDEAAVFKTQVLVEKNRQDEALKFIRGFVAKVKDSAAAWFYAGKLEQSKDHTNEAVKDYRKSLENRPGFTQATLALGLIFETHGETTKALDLYQDQLEEKQDVQVAGRLATLYLKLGQLDYALKTLEVMAALDSDDLNTQLKIGLVHMQMQDWTEAKKIFTALLDKVPDSDKVHYYLAAVLEEQTQVESAIEHLLKVTADSKLFEDSNVHAALLYRKLSQEQKAMETVQAAIKKSPENASFYLMMASLYEDKKDLKDASSSLEDGLKIFPDHEKMLYFHGAILDKLGKADEAVAEMEKIIQHNPNQADALNFVAYTWTAQGVRLKDAEEMLKHALKLKPDSPFILDSMGWNQFMLGNNRAALVFLEKAASLKSDEQTILEHLVEVYARSNMPERAESTRVRIRKLVDNEAADILRSPASVEQK